MYVVLAASSGEAVPPTVSVRATGPAPTIAATGVVGEPATGARAAPQPAAPDDVVSARTRSQVRGEHVTARACRCRRRVTRAAAPARAGAAGLPTLLPGILLPGPDLPSPLTGTYPHHGLLELLSLLTLLQYVSTCVKSRYK